MYREESIPLVDDGEQRGTVEIRCTDRWDGDFSIHTARDTLRRNRESVTQHPWWALHQVHGAAVHEAPIDMSVEAHRNGTPPNGDALICAVPNNAISVQTADCIGIALYSLDGEQPIIAVAHGGWRGLYENVVGHTAAAMRAQGAHTIYATTGPYISATQYEFGNADLTTMALRFGPDVVAATNEGTGALNLDVALSHAFREASVIDTRTAAQQHGVASPTHEAVGTASCTSSADFYSHRVRGDLGRQCVVMWLARSVHGDAQPSSEVRHHG